VPSVPERLNAWPWVPGPRPRLGFPLAFPSSCLTGTMSNQYLICRSRLGGRLIPNTPKFAETASVSGATQFPGSLAESSSGLGPAARSMSTGQPYRNLRFVPEPEWIRDGRSFSGGSQS
jgi:hypothetical protein